MKHVQRRAFVFTLSASLLAALFAVMTALSVPAAASNKTNLAPQQAGATITALAKLQQSILATKTAIAQLSATPAASPTRQATSTSAPTSAPTRTPTATPTPLLPMIEVIVATINMRSGPGAQHPVVGRGAAGDLYPVVGRTDGCSWLQIVLEDASQVWVSGASAYTNLNIPCSAVPVGEDAIAAAIPTATSTPRPTRPSPTTPATPTVAATLPTPTRQAATPIPDTQGPIAVQVSAPPDGLAGGDRVVFSWIPDRELVQGQVYELAFWRPGENWSVGKSLTAADRSASVEIRLGNLAPGQYVWGVILGAVDTDGSYRRLRYLGGDRTVMVSDPTSSGGDSGGDSGGSSGGSSGEDPHAGEK